MCRPNLANAPIPDRPDRADPAPVPLRMAQKGYRRKLWRVLAQIKMVRAPRRCFCLAFSAPPLSNASSLFRKRRGVGQRTGLVGHWRKTQLFMERKGRTSRFLRWHRAMGRTVSGPYERRLAYRNTTPGIVEASCSNSWGTSRPPVRFSSTWGNGFGHYSNTQIWIGVE